MNEITSDLTALSRHLARSKKIRTFDITPDELKSGFEDTLASEVEIKAELGKRTLAQLAPKGTGGLKKAQVIASIYNNLLECYALESFTWSPFSEKRVDALRRQVNATNEETIQRLRDKRAEAIAEQQRILESPQTLSDFGRYMSYKKVDDTGLPPELKVRYDALMAEQVTAQRKADMERKSVVQSIEIGDISMELLETKHTKKGHDLFVVCLAERVGSDTFKELTQKAHQLDGSYSSYNRDGAIPGFQFRTRENAESFMKLKEGDVSSHEIKEQQQEQVKENAVERLRNISKNMTETAQESLSRDRKDNTIRRARMASSAEDKARADLAMADTIKNITDAIEDGSAKLLGQVRSRADIETLDSVLSRAHYLWAGSESKNGNGRFEDLRQAPVTIEQVDFAEYPFPSVHREIVVNLAKAVQNISGCKRAAEKVTRYADQALRADKWQVIGNSSEMRDNLLIVAREAAEGTKEHYAGQELLEGFKTYNRLQKMGFVNLPSLRAGLREYIQMRGVKAQPDKNKQLERELIGRKIDGFFPTPKSLADKVVLAANIQPGDKVLEPEAGKGDIADSVVRLVPEADLMLNEIVPSLVSILKQKGYSDEQLRCGDFLDMSPEEYAFDKIVMNPPFEDGQDIAHLRHAYKLLKPRGTVSSVMSEGPFFRSDAKSEEFRGWIEEVGGSDEKLPEGSFKDGFRSTGVATRLVTITKPDDAPLAQDFKNKQDASNSALSNTKVKMKQLSLF